MISIAAPGVFAFASLASLIAMGLAVLLVSLAVSLPLSITRIGQCFR